MVKVNVVVLSFVLYLPLSLALFPFLSHFLKSLYEIHIYVYIKNISQFTHHGGMKSRHLAAMARERS